MSGRWTEGATASAALEGARRLGTELLERALDDGNGITWRCPNPPPRIGQRVEWRAQESVYDGTAGIALFLAELAAVTGEARFHTAADGAIRWLLARCEEPSPEGRGLYVGRAGTCLVLARCGGLAGDSTLRRRALELALELSSGPEAPGPHDLLAGRSGIALLLAHLYAATGERALRSRLAAVVETLARNALAGSQGLCWDRSHLCAQPLCGMAHGASGVGLALLVAGHLLGSPGAVWLGRQAFHYEEARAAESDGRWPDLRRDDVFLDVEAHLAAGDPEPAALLEPRAMHGWCAGAAGIGLARLAAYRLLGDPRHRRQAERALELARRSPSRASLPDLTLCHGLCGDGELFLAAAAVLEEPRWLAAADGIAQTLLRCEARSPGAWFRASGRAALEGDPGLFLGATGAGYFLLRVATRGAVPSVADPAPRLRRRLSSGAAAPDVAACRRVVLRTTFPSLVPRLESDHGEALAAYLLEQDDGDLVDGWDDGFLDWAAARLDPVGRETAALERRKRHIDRGIANDALLAFRALLRRRRSETLTVLSDAELLTLRLRTCPELEWWSSTEGVAPRLLEPRATRVREVRLSNLAHAVLEGYGTGRDGITVAAEVMAGAELDGAGRRELEQRVAAQVRAALARGLLEEVPP